MTDYTLLGPWIRRFLLEHMVAERNLSLNTQKSYRDMLVQLLPYVAGKARKTIDRLTVDDLSPQVVRLFLAHREQQRNCAISTSVAFMHWRDSSLSMAQSISIGAPRFV